MALLDGPLIEPLLSCSKAPSSHTCEAGDNYAPIYQPDVGKGKQVPANNISTMSAQVNSSRLLALPKELRLEIWQHVLTGCINARLVLRIMRDIGGPNTSGKRFSNSLYKHPSTPEMIKMFETSPASPISVALLRTNHLIYSEALPILYHAVTFCPWHLEGIFPLFLEHLSEFARNNIRYIRVVPPAGLPGSSSHFYWALTCAQVAKLNESVSLREVEVESKELVWGDKDFFKRAILLPLLKIKAPRVFSGRNAAEYQQLMAEAGAEREARQNLRRAAREIDDLEKRRVANLTRFNTDLPPKKKQKLQEITIRGKAEEPILSPVVDEREVARELAEVPGSEWWGKDLSEWDMLSVRSRSPCPSFHSFDIENNDGWTDPVSAVTGKNTDDELADKDADDWELVDEMSLRDASAVA